jgi:large subunit ribosomal protein L22
MIARARLHGLRMSPRKVRIVLDLIRGRPVEDAYRALAFVPRRSAEPIRKLLQSAVANAGQKGGPGPEALRVSRTYADGGLMFRKFEAKAMLRHGMQKKRTCHVTIELDALAGAGTQGG